MGFFSFKRSTSKTRQAHLAIEQLSERLVPAVIPSMTNFSAGVLHIETDQNTDTIAIADHGRNGIQVTVTGDAAGQTAVNNALNQAANAGQSIRTIQIHESVRSGVRSLENRITYNADTFDAGVQRTVEVNLSASNDISSLTSKNTFNATVAGLGQRAILDLIYRGGAGDDDVNAMVSGTYAESARLNLNFNGGAGNKDVIKVDAASKATNITSGGQVSVDLSGFRTGSKDGSNELSLTYRGQLSGNLQYRMDGSGGRDFITADLVFLNGSTGSVGDTNRAGRADMFGDSGDDILTFNYTLQKGASVRQQQFNAVAGAGTDVLLVNADASRILLDNGRLDVSLAGTTAGYVMRFSDIETANIRQIGSGNSVIDARDFTGNTLLSGGSGSDLIFGSATGKNELHGGLGGGSNVLIGGSAADVLYGEGTFTSNGFVFEGNQILIGGGGADILYGGMGHDLLVAGWTDFDRQSLAQRISTFSALLNWWGNSSLSLEDHAKGLRDQGDVNNPGFVFNENTVHYDQSDVTMRGRVGGDLYYAPTWEYDLLGSFRTRYDGDRTPERVGLTDFTKANDQLFILN